MIDVIPILVVLGIVIVVAAAQWAVGALFDGAAGLGRQGRENREAERFARRFGEDD